MCYGLFSNVFCTCIYLCLYSYYIYYIHWYQRYKYNIRKKA